MAARDGSETKSTMTPTIRRQPSIEEDLQYTELVGARSQAPAEPPTHEAEIHSLHGEGKASEAKVGRSDTASRMTSAEPAPVGPSSPGPSVGLRHGERQVEEALPPYSCDIQLEGVFLRKMEIEEATRRAAKRSWKHVYVVLQGTSLRVYRTRRKWWESGLANSIGPGISPDNLPWIKRGPLERSYSLLYADAGIAADYRKYALRLDTHGRLLAVCAAKRVSC